MKRAWKWVGGLILAVGAAYLTRQVYVDVTTPMPEWERGAADAALDAARREGNKHNIEVGFIVYKTKDGVTTPYDGASA